MEEKKLSSYRDESKGSFSISAHVQGTNYIQQDSFFPIWRGYRSIYQSSCFQCPSKYTQSNGIGKYVLYCAMPPDVNTVFDVINCPL